MLFAKLFLALPFIGAAIAAPILGLDKVLSPTLSSISVEKKTGLDVLAAVTELKVSVSASVVGISLVSTEVEVEAALVAVVAAFDHCQSVVGVAVGAAASLDLDILGGLETKLQVAAIIADVIKTVNGLVLVISTDVQKIAKITALLHKLPTIIGTLLHTVESIFIGISLLVGNVLLLLKYKLCPILCPVNSILGGLLTCILA